MALQSVIAMVENEKDKALNLAQGAVEATPSSATALIVRTIFARVTPAFP